MISSLADYKQLDLTRKKEVLIALVGATFCHRLEDDQWEHFLCLSSLNRLGWPEEEFRSEVASILAPLPVPHTGQSIHWNGDAWVEIEIPLPPPTVPAWNPAPVWQQFICGYFSPGDLHCNPYNRINTIANSTAPHLNLALTRLALAWLNQQNVDFWRERVAEALFNLEAQLTAIGVEHAIAAHPDEVELFEHWNNSYGLGLTFPWGS